MTRDEVISELGDGFYACADLDTLDAICCEQQDEEAVESVLPFLGKPWRAITSGDWNSYPKAISFLSDRAFMYFLPSLIHHSLSAPQLAQLAVDNLLFELRPIEFVKPRKKKERKWLLDREQIRKQKARRTDRWNLLNDRQLSLVGAWLGALAELSIYDLNDIQNARNTLNQIAVSRKTLS